VSPTANSHGRRVLFGRPLKSSEQNAERLTKFRALAALAPDALSSVAYGPQQIMLALFLVGGTAALRFAAPVALAIAGLLCLLIFSYTQICLTYPNGGGAFIVSRENLGEMPSLLAGAALFIGYTFTVSTSVAAGADAITSAFPELLHWHVLIALFYILIITVLNLRGVSESATTLTWPLYLFLLAMFLLIGIGLFHHLPAGAPLLPPAMGGLGMAGGTIGLFVLLRAFSHGSSTLTGVEAISNGVPLFRDPAPRNAQLTLVALGLLLGSMMLGVAHLGAVLHVNPTENRTVLAQIAAMVFYGPLRPLFYYVQFIASIILILAANTSYSGFPIMASVMAEHRFMPNMFTNRDDRLVFNNGILALSCAAAFFVIVLRGDTTNLIAPYSTGVFLGFTLSQLGNGVYCLRQRIAGWRWRMLVSFVGAAATFTAMWVFLITQFFQGAWMVLIIIPLLVLFSRAVRAHYGHLADQLRMPPGELPLVLGPRRESVVVVPVSSCNRMVVDTLDYARSLSTRVVAVNVSFSEEQSQAFRQKWERTFPDIRVVCLVTQYRQVLRTLVHFVETLDVRTGENTFVTVLIPEFVPHKMWHNLLHNQLGLRLYSALKFHCSHVVVASVPHRLAL